MGLLLEIYEHGLVFQNFPLHSKSLYSKVLNLIHTNFCLQDVPSVNI